MRIWKDVTIRPVKTVGPIYAEHDRCRRGFLPRMVALLSPLAELVRSNYATLAPRDHLDLEVPHPHLALPPVLESGWTNSGLPRL